MVNRGAVKDSHQPVTQVHKLPRFLPPVQTSIILMRLSLAFRVWPASPHFQTSVRLTLNAFSRSVNLKLSSWQSGHPHLVLPSMLVHNAVTFTWPCHVSHGRWMSSNQGRVGNCPHPDFRRQGVKNERPFILDLCIFSLCKCRGEEDIGGY